MNSFKNTLSLRDQKIPYNLTIEKTILAEILLNKENLALIFYKVRKEFFYLKNHQHIFEASKQIYEEQIEVNIDTISDRLNLSGDLETIGGIEELVNIINIVLTPSDIDSYIVLLIDKYIRRQVIYGAKRIESLAYQSFDSIESLFDEAEKILFSITQEKPSNSLLLTSEVLLETFVDLENRSIESKYSGIKSGFFDLDEVTQGFQRSDLIIIAGRPSMGKTAFALNIARNVSELQDSPVIIFSLEMSRQQLVYRFLSKESQVMHSKLRTGNINQKEWYSVSQAINLLASLKIYLDDSPNLSLTSIRNKVNSLQIQYGNIGMIVLDYLQLLNDPKNKDSRVQELSRLTRGLKMLAKEFDTPFIVLSQLSRSVESRVNKRPLLSDLRESGCVGADMKLYRPYENRYVSISKLVYEITHNSVISRNHNLKSQLSSSTTARLRRGYYTGVKFIYHLKTLNKNSLKVTGTHKLLTLKGWIEANQLANYDLIGILDINNFSKRLTVRERDIQTKIRFFPNIAFVCLGGMSIVGEHHSYDLWVPATNCYVVNNSLVHNSIEQDADLVLMLYRDSYYDNESNDAIEDNITEIIITKHRNGPVGTINMLFEPRTLTFDNFIF
uniref:Replicative DNA helicase n=1 Tax=Rhodomonas salina TaxID=3034 RepID=A6MVP6_RHDSA|nr:DNA replication helicase [Rhodomonas salina]ABO70865.1 DNA replication helicase [Rhodomonas salina]